MDLSHYTTRTTPRPSQSLETYAEPYKERLSTTRSSPQASSSGAQTSKIDALFALDFNPSLVYGDELT